MSMKRKFGFVPLVVLIWAFSARAADTVLILSSADPEYQAVAAGFRSAFAGTFREINLEGSDIKLKSVGEELKTKPPGVAVVVGDLAAQMAKWYLEKIPVIYCDAIRAAQISLSGQIGIYHEPDPGEQMKLIRQLFPEKTRIGLLYCPAYARISEVELKKQAQTSGLTLEIAALGSVKELPVKFRGLLPKVDLLWVFTDPSVISSHSIQYIVLQSVSSGVPIFCGNNSLAHLGATAAMIPDQADAGLKAAQVTQQLLGGTKPTPGTVLYPKGKLVINTKISALLKVSFPPALAGQAVEVIQ